MSDEINITRIKVVYDALQELASEVIFVGGATVSLYSDRPTGETRPTDDVDILVELLNYGDYAAIEEQLRRKGFINDVESGVICRYTVRGITVDVMPTSESILGFTNRWYEAAFNAAVIYIINEEYKIKIFSAPYFIATKLEAFKGRGQQDGRTSSDFEDIIFTLNNRTTIWQEMLECSDDLKQYLKIEFQELLGHDYIEEWISCHLDYHEQKRINFIMGSLQEFVNE